MSEQPLFAIPVSAAEIRPGDIVVSHRGAGHPADHCGQCNKDVQVVCAGNKPGAGPTDGKRIVRFNWHLDGKQCGTCLTGTQGPHNPNHAWDRA